jgi:EmrB/QacA subfamily drug resistance transporter
VAEGRGFSPRTKRLTLLASILGSSIVFIDGTVVNVALPAIADDLDAGLSGQQWVVEAYLLVLSSLLLVGGSLGDLFGRRRVFAAGVAAFGVMSIVCGLAPNTEILTVSRALQGAAGALLVPSTLAILIATFPPDERGGAIGSWTAWGGVSTVIGPLAGGLLVEFASWRWIFLIGLVPIALTLFLVWHAVPPELDEREPGHVDFAGATLCALGLAGVVFALIEQPTYGWSDPRIALPLVGGVVLLVLFLLQERRSPDPMLPLSLFRRRNFAAGNAATLTMYAGLGSATFFLPLFLQQVGGYTALAAGLSLLPLTVIMFLLSKRFGALADRIGPHSLMTAGPLIAGVGLLGFMRIDASADYVTQVLPAALVFALGLSMTVAPLTAAVLAGADEHHAGVASGVNNAIARVAGLLAIGAVGAVVAAQFSSALDERLAGVVLSPPAQTAVARADKRPLSGAGSDAVPASERAVVATAIDDASVDAFRAGMLISGALVIAGGVISFVGVRNPRRRVSAEECPGGAVCGASEDVARAYPPTRVPAGRVAEGARA